MASKKKLLQAAAGSAGGAGLDVDEVFNTFLYTGTADNSSISVNNGIDLSGEGGLVWIKGRDSTRSHYLYDTARGTTKALVSAQSNGEFTISNAVTAFNNNGFTVGPYDDVNTTDEKTQVAWTFRKAPKFFDVQTWTGDGTTDRSISHNLGQVPGMIIAKKTSGTGDWHVLHRSVTMSGTGNSSTGGLKLNATGGSTYYTHQWEHTYPEATLFKVSHVSGASSQTLNTSGENYVAYLFAHNNNDGEFGPDSDQDVIKCGSYTGNGSTQSISLGFEPQFIFLKSTSSSSNWVILDAMRGVVTSSSAADDKYLFPNSNTSEGGGIPMNFTATGFDLANEDTSNKNGDTFIYMAIRRGPLAAPESATDVFEPVAYSGSGNTGNVIGNINRADLVIIDDRNNDTDLSSYGATVFDRLRGPKALKTSSANADEGGWSTGYFGLDQSNGWRTGNTDTNYLNKASRNYISWAWKRAPEYFDVVAYTGTGSARTVSHNLGAVPEMMWIKNRDASESWIVYHKALGATKYAMLDKDNAEVTNSSRFNDTTPTASVFTVGTDNSTNSANSNNHVAYLFATVAGISKVGSYTGNGSNGHIIDCGFSSGARFILIRLVGTSGSWYIFDTTRGIVSGSDPYLKLDVTDAEASSDLVDPHSSGFIVNNSALINANGYTHIFYAIA